VTLLHVLDASSHIYLLEASEAAICARNFLAQLSARGPASSFLLVLVATGPGKLIPVMVNIWYGVIFVR
jgi:hypothetical protein